MVCSIIGKSMRASYTGSDPDTSGFFLRHQAPTASSRSVSILIIVSLWAATSPLLFPASPVLRHPLAAAEHEESRLNLREPAFVKVARRGFNQMYNLDYEEAIETFRSLREEYPQHPAPPLYLAILT